MEDDKCKEPTENGVLCDLCCMVERVLRDEKLSRQEKSDTLKKMTSIINEERAKLNSSQNILEFASDYPRYPGKHEDALKWLEKHWGKHLKFFGAEKNSIYQDQLRAIDPDLLVAITCGKYKKIIESQGLKIRDVIPRKSERITEEINILCKPKDVQDYLRIYSASAQRTHRVRKSQDFIKKPPANLIS